MVTVFLRLNKKILLLTLFTPLLAGAEPSAITDVIDCVDQYVKVNPGEGTIARILKRDGITGQDLRWYGEILSGSEGARLYTTKSKKFKFIIKPATGYWTKDINQNLEVAAYILHKKIGLSMAPQTEDFYIKDERYSVQKFVASPKVTRNESWYKRYNIAKFSKNPIPDQILIFDALCGNLDRKPEGKNYLIITPDDFTEELKNSNELITIKNPTFIVIDNKILENSLSKWLDFKDMKFFEFKKMLKRNYPLLKGIQSWSDNQIRTDLEDYLNQTGIESLLKRRKEILEIGGLK